MRRFRGKPNIRRISAQPLDNQLHRTHIPRLVWHFKVSLSHSCTSLMNNSCTFLPWQRRACTIERKQVIKHESAACGYTVAFSTKPRTLLKQHTSGVDLCTEGIQSSVREKTVSQYIISEYQHHTTLNTFTGQTIRARLSQHEIVCKHKYKAVVYPRFLRKIISGHVHMKHRH